MNTKKLTLNKETMRTLSDQHSDEVVGGGRIDKSGSVGDTLCICYKDPASAHTWCDQTCWNWSNAC